MSQVFLNPLETTNFLINSGNKKGNENFFKILLGGILAGIFIGMAGIGQITLSYSLSSQQGLAKLAGASVFPIGLMLCVFMGASLFTGNSLISISVLANTLSFYKLFRNLFIVWIGNFIGGIFTAFVSYFSGIFASQDIQSFIISSAVSKINLSFTQALFSGFLCNMLVAAGVIMAMSSSDAIGKIFSCWFPIMLFVLSGYQHIVANIYILSLAKILLSSSIPLFSTFINHIIPVTIGNFISGGVFIPLVLYNLYIKNK